MTQTHPKQTIRFPYLRLKTEYDMNQGMVGIDKAVARAASYGIPALAMNDVNLCGMVHFTNACINHGIKPIIGMEWIIVSDIHYRIAVLVKDQTGYENLCHIIYQSALKNPGKLETIISEDDLFALPTEGLIVLSGHGFGLFHPYFHFDQIRAKVKTFANHFKDRFYLEMMSFGAPNETSINQFTMHLGIECDIPVVATHPILFLNQEDFEAHKIWRNIIKTNAPNATPEQYFVHPDVLESRFHKTAWTNAIEIAKRCNFFPEFKTFLFPNIDIPKEAITSKIRETCIRFLSQKFNGSIPPEYMKRMEEEIQVIQAMGFGSYFLIVADFVQWAKRHHVPVGPGRGSGAGSLVAYGLEITSIDPIRHGLIFERFLNPERVSLPDFDIDFCQDKRDLVVQYISEKYGHDKTARIGTIGRIGAKASLRDTGRVLGIPYSVTNRISKTIPNQVHMTLDKALEENADFRQLIHATKENIDWLTHAKKLENMPKSIGTHAGGVLISPKPLSQIMPMYCVEADIIQTQLDKDDVERLGLIKFDLLGLKTVSVIQNAIESISRFHHIPAQTIYQEMDDLNDQDVFDMLNQGYVDGVFQLESEGMKKLIKSAEIKSFNDLVAILALFRPGPLQSGMVKLYIENKKNPQDIHYDHEMLKPILSETHGVIIYQEQVMRIAQNIARYTLGQADLLRRAMGKKKMEEMVKNRAQFIQGAVHNGFDEDFAKKLFDNMEKFAEYGFNKSHSVAYGVLSYQTAWLKKKYPEHFLAALLTYDSRDKERMAKLAMEARRLGIKILPVHINKSDVSFAVERQNTIRAGLSCLIGIGQDIVKKIVDERNENGLFLDFEEYLERIKRAKIKLNKKQMMAMIQSGAFDWFDANRKNMEQRQILISQKQNSLELIRNLGLHPMDDYTPMDKIRLEQQHTGIYFSGDPCAIMKGEIKKEIPIVNIDYCKEVARKKVIVFGIILSVRTFTNQEQNKQTAYLTLYDDTDSMDCVIYDDLWNKCKAQVKDGSMVLVEGTYKPDKGRLSVKNIEKLDF